MNNFGIKMSKIFLRENYEFIPDDSVWIEVKILYEVYRKWIISRGYGPCNIRVFGKAVRSVFPKMSKVRKGKIGKRVYVFEGVQEKI
ncbi:MAG: primase-like DNA-binding domain-containing protein [Candidatus Bathyarchaeota archaeon]|jgi:hypothetical protein